MSYTVVIPARFGSTRLPGKPLLDIGGVPMVQRVWEQALASGADRVLIATDDTRVVEAGRAFGAEVCMTSPEHPSGTDRLQEVAALLGLSPEQVVVNVQGDEPMIPPRVIDQVAANLLACAGAGMATLCEKIGTYEDLCNPGVVKVVRDAADMALYFSRAVIPWPRDVAPAGAGPLPESGQWLRHIGLYAYRVELLDQFVSWSPAPQEQVEKLEQLRVLHNGVGVHVDIACEPVPAGVDTAADLAAVRRLFAGDS